MEKSKKSLDDNKSTNLQEDKAKELQNQLILMVTRQTEYSYDEAKDKLILHNNDYMKVIKEFMNIDNKKTNNNKTTNQQIYTEIRSMMDDAASNYRKQQEYNKQKEQYMMAINAKKQYIIEQANKKIKQQKEEKEKESIKDKITNDNIES